MTFADETCEERSRSEEKAIRDITSSLLRELDAVALATNVMVFLGREPRRIGEWSHAPRLRVDPR